jgi:hypothetical protein
MTGCKGTTLSPPRHSAATQVLAGIGLQHAEKG